MVYVLLVLLIAHLVQQLEVENVILVMKALNKTLEQNFVKPVLLIAKLVILKELVNAILVRMATNLNLITLLVKSVLIELIAKHVPLKELANAISVSWDIKSKITTLYVCNVSQIVIIVIKLLEQTIPYVNLVVVNLDMYRRETEAVSNAQLVVQDAL